MSLRLRNPRHFSVRQESLKPMARNYVSRTKPIEKKTENYIEAGLDRGLPTVKVGKRTTTTEVLTEKDRFRRVHKRLLA